MNVVRGVVLSIKRIYTGYIMLRESNCSRNDVESEEEVILRLATFGFTDELSDREAKVVMLMGKFFLPKQVRSI